MVLGRNKPATMDIPPTYAEEKEFKFLLYFIVYRNLFK